MFPSHDQGGRDPSRSSGGFCCNRHYNGSSWSAEGALSNGMYASGGTGTQNATLAFAGYTAPSSNGYQTPRSCVEEYDGTSWSTQNRIINALGAGNSAGTSNDALSLGGYAYPSTVPYNQLWNGTTWSTATNLLLASKRLGSGGDSSGAAIVTNGLNCLGTFEFTCNEVIGAGLATQRTEVTVNL